MKEAVYETLKKSKNLIKLFQSNYIWKFLLQYKKESNIKCSQCRFFVLVLCITELKFMLSRVAQVYICKRERIRSFFLNIFINLSSKVKFGKTSKQKQNKTIKQSFEICFSLCSIICFTPLSTEFYTRHE